MKIPKCGIYKITNKVNGKIYIGQSVDIEKRWKDHKNNSNYVYKNNHLYSAMRKYGLDNFLFEVIVECDEHMLDEFEIGIIKLYDTTNRAKGYNLSFGGSNGRLSNETKKKISKTKKGQNHSNETKAKMSKAQKGRVTTNETKQKLSESKKGDRNPQFGKTLSDEHKKKLIAANKVDKTKQYLYQGIIYNGKQELADFLGMTYKNLSNRIFRKRIDVTIIPKKSID